MIFEGDERRLARRSRDDGNDGLARKFDCGIVSIFHTGVVDENYVACKTVTHLIGVLLDSI